MRLHLKEDHIDEILAIILALLVFLVGLAWNSLIDTIIRVYGDPDSVELAFFYALLVTVIAFAFGDYLVNNLKIKPHDCSGYMHRFLGYLGKAREEPEE